MTARGVIITPSVFLSLLRMPLVCAPSLALAELVWGAPKHLANYTGAKGQNIKNSVGFGNPAAAPTGVGSKPLQKNRKRKRRQYTFRRYRNRIQPHMSNWGDASPFRRASFKFRRVLARRRLHVLETYSAVVSPHAIARIAPRVSGMNGIKVSGP